MTAHRSDCPCDDCWVTRRTAALKFRANPDRRHAREPYAPKTTSTERTRRYRQRKAK